MREGQKQADYRHEAIKVVKLMIKIVSAVLGLRVVQLIGMVICRARIGNSMLLVVNEGGERLSFVHGMTKQSWLVAS